ncbi:hypothetical protein NS365_01170 [Aureimonas ureilytica]|uniref:Uncharacterized protein n=1 Tax=Aureimonas ureilytica TaxID=401562 RepID=A0A147DBM5_9HYPH|nr:hypothetical protein [Aureimonas ureilytica]KTR08576.1 hypothetical protein NS365_01170 [Aureimonas ureilytica]
MAHTRDNPGDPAAAIEADQDDFFGDAGPLFAGPVKHVADTIEKAKGRGRPKGAANKRTTAMRDLILAMGFRHPALNLAALANASPDELAKELNCEKAEAMAFILKANVEMMPYMESKRPVEVHVEERSLGVLVVGEMPSQAVADGVFSLTGEIAEVEEDQ